MNKIKYSGKGKIKFYEDAGMVDDGMSLKRPVSAPMVSAKPLTAQPYVNAEGIINNPQPASSGDEKAVTSKKIKFSAPLTMTVAPANNNSTVTSATPPIKSEGKKLSYLNWKEQVAADEKIRAQGEAMYQQSLASSRERNKQGNEGALRGAYEGMKTAGTYGAAVASKFGLGLIPATVGLAGSIGGNLMDITDNPKNWKGELVDVKNDVVDIASAAALGTVLSKVPPLSKIVKKIPFKGKK